MRIVIVGPGAMGCLLATTLHRGLAENDTLCLLDYNRERACSINDSGILYEREDFRRQTRIPTYSDPAAIGRADALVICVKSYDVAKTLAFCAPLLKRDILLIFMQNGIDHLQYRNYVTDAPAAFGTSTEGATNLGHGHVRHAGQGITSLGFLDPPAEKHRMLLPQLIERLRGGGMDAASTETVLGRIWDKLFINVGINALTVIHDCPNGKLLEIPQARAQMRKAIEEARQVALQENIQATTPLQNTEAVCLATAKNISSMLQDVRKKRKTEIDAINGAIVKLAQKHGIATPTNENLVRQVKEIENRYGKSSD